MSAGLQHRADRVIGCSKTVATQEVCEPGREPPIFISHCDEAPHGPFALARTLTEYRDRILNTNDLTQTKKVTLNLLDGLADCELGRFLLFNRGFNGYWTSYVFHKGYGKRPANEIESWILNRSLLTQARERFERFKSLLAQHVRDGIRMASIPSGLMDDLLELDYAGVEGFRLTAVDADVDSLELAREQASRQALLDHCDFLWRDAWDLGIDAKFDVISSNGLNMYEGDTKRLIALYRNFQRALRPKGLLLISFLPPPLGEAKGRAVWAACGMTDDDMKVERSIFRDIIRPKYFNFVSEAQLREQLRIAGFSLFECTYNAQGILPIMKAWKN